MSEAYKVHDDTKAYFITFSVIQWINLFHIDKYAQIIVNSLKYCQAHKYLEIFAYCIMPNHVHLLARAGNTEIPLPGIIRDSKKFTSVQIIRQLISDGDKQQLVEIFEKHGRENSRNMKYKVWQDGYHPIENISPAMFKQKLNYIHPDFDNASP